MAKMLNIVGWFDRHRKEGPGDGRPQGKGGS
jgi:hypothetical protein